MALRTGEHVYTRILPEGAFWPAERMHQKFDLQRVYPDLVRELAAGSVDGNDAANDGGDPVNTFLASPAATRLNAYVSGFRHPHLLVEAGSELGWTVEDLERCLNASDPDGKSEASSE